MNEPGPETIAKPSRLFLDPDQFNAALELTAFRAHQAEIAKLRDRLFAK